MRDTPQTSQLANDGYCILPSVFSNSEVERFREAAVSNLGAMGKTREVTHSFHLAGFHRFPALSSLHSDLAANGTINSFLSDYYDGDSYCAFGLSDITVNRSQHWHTDLLRGDYSHFLPDGVPWLDVKRTCIKALAYLQTGKSLKIVPGSHLHPSPLDDELLDHLAQSAAVTQLEIQSGDVVMMDIRALHRGSTDEEMRAPKLFETPKILISTVFGAIDSTFTQAMQLGNAHRMMQWDRRHLRKDHKS